MEKSKITSWERYDEIGVLSLENDKKNYLDDPVFVEMEKLKQWAGEPGLKGIIIRGTGRHFSAGANVEKLGEMAQQPQILLNKISEGKKLLNFIEDLEIPVIAAINGICFGGGLEIALAAHIRVASENAILSFPEINHGLIPGLGGIFRLSELSGKSIFDLVLLGDMIDANTALNMGVINHISNTKDAFAFAKSKLLGMVSDRPVNVIRYAMQAIHNARNLNRDEALMKETELFCKLAVNVSFHQLNNNV